MLRSQNVFFFGYVSEKVQLFVERGEILRFFHFAILIVSPQHYDCVNICRKLWLPGCSFHLQLGDMSGLKPKRNGLKRNTEQSDVIRMLKVTKKCGCRVYRKSHEKNIEKKCVKQLKKRCQFGLSVSLKIVI